MSRAQINSVLRSASRQTFTATAGQTAFTITGGYIAGSIDVYANGVKMVLGSDYTATNGTSITLVNASAENDTVDVVSGVTAMGGVGQVTRQSFIATDAQTVFTVAGGYQPNAIDVYKNGVKLQNGTDVTVTSGSTFTIATPCIVNDIIDVSANQVTGLTGVTNLSTTQDSTTVTVVSDTGADAILPAATTSLAGVMTAADKVSLRNYGMKNRIINGGMDISQRGTTFVTPADGAYTLDRFGNTNTTDGAFTITQNADVPSNLEFQNSLRVAVTTADTSIATAQFATLFHMLEGYNIRDLIGRTFTLSFWVRSTKTGIHCIALRSGGYDRSYTAEYSISTSNTWEFKTITIAGGMPSTGTWNYTNGVGLVLSFMLSNGSTFQTTAGSWQNGNFQSTSNQVNCLDTIGNIFAITGVQLEVGSQATEFEHRPIGTELALCQRYWTQSYAYGQAAGTSGSGSYACLICGNSTVQLFGTILFRVIMRASPSFTIYSFSGTLNKFSDGSGTDQSGTAAISLDQAGIYSGANTTALTLGTPYLFHYTANAEL